MSILTDFKVQDLLHIHVTIYRLTHLHLLVVVHEQRAALACGVDRRTEWSLACGVDRRTEWSLACGVDRRTKRESGNPYSTSSVVRDISPFNPLPLFTPTRAPTLAGMGK